jgi:hypothetical protein
MADISSLVKYEQSFALKIVHPHTRKDTGMVFQIRHRDCDAAQAVVERHMMADMEEAANGTRPGPSELACRAPKRAVERLAACVDGWDWGEDPDGKPNTYNGENLSYTKENAVMVLSETHWLHDAVLAGVNNLENFI